jgi:hypothetical protein
MGSPGDEHGLSLGDVEVGETGLHVGAQLLHQVGQAGVEVIRLEARLQRALDFRLACRTATLYYSNCAFLSAWPVHNWVIIIASSYCSK